VRGERESIAIDNELETAREIQQSILPRAMPNVNGLRFHAGYVPATSVGGDMYSFLSADAGTGVLVADVAGHGVPAALIASMVKIAVSSQSRLADDPAALLGELDAILRRDVRRALVTATYLWFDMARRRVAVSNAGHPPPLLYREGTFLELGGTGVLLGRFSDARYTTTFTNLLSGDRIVAYTDGIPEARNARDEMFGEERLKETIRGSATADDVLAAVHRWRGSATEDADDLTIVVVDVL
jgi:sigma-B regulation protein RsbU (phosphoserine phosphatase)